MVFRRTDVEQALTEKRWLYRGRKVRRSELEYPIKSTKARKTSTKGFKALKSYGVGLSNDGGNEFKKMQLEAGEAALDDGMENIYASWQTDPWSPTPISANDAIPVNEHRNVELELLNPGLVHVTLHRVSKVAKQLGMCVSYVKTIVTFCRASNNSNFYLYLFQDPMLPAYWVLRVMAETARQTLAASLFMHTMKNCCAKLMLKWPVNCSKRNTKITRKQS